MAIRIEYGDTAPPPPEQVRLALQKACAEANVELPPPRSDESLWEYFHRKDADFWDGRNRLVTPVLVFDQFEELFTLGRSSNAARQRGGLLLDDLSGLVENRPPAVLKRLGDSGDADTSGFDLGPSRCKVLLSLREDFLADLHKLKPLFPTILQNEIGLEAMSGSAAAEAVDESGGHLVAPGVTRRIVHFVAASATSGESPDAAAADGNLSALKVEPALLSVVCSELNARRRERGLPQITSELLVDSRQGILTDFFERGVSDLPPEARCFVEDRLLTRGGYRISVAARRRPLPPRARISRLPHPRSARPIGLAPAAAHRRAARPAANRADPRHPRRPPSRSASRRQRGGGGEARPPPPKKKLDARPPPSKRRKAQRANDRPGAGRAVRRRAARPEDLD